MIVVCDASPLIILAKIDRLPLLGAVFEEEITVLRSVFDEVLGDRAGVAERQRLEAFFDADARVVEFCESDVESKSLSKSDQYSLTYCQRNQVDWLVVDERLLRRVATGAGISVIGVLGLLVAGVRRGLLSKEEARLDLERAVGEFELRISVALFQRVLRELS